MKVIIFGKVESEVFYEIVVMVKESEVCVKEEVDKKVKEILFFVM